MSKISILDKVVTGSKQQMWGIRNRRNSPSCPELQKCPSADKIVKKRKMTPKLLKQNPGLATDRSRTGKIEKAKSANCPKAIKEKPILNYNN